MANAISSSGGIVRLQYESIRNLTSPEEKANGAKSYFANVPIAELLKLDTAENLRGYIPDHPGKNRNQIHKAIGETLRSRSDRFIQLSSGITVCATDIAIDDDKKLVTITNGSIINGAQTQGEIRLFLEDFQEKSDEFPAFHARVEFIVEPDKENIVETAIARNTSTNIQRISMAGKKKYFDDLNQSFKKIFPKLSLSTSETEVGDNFVDTQRLLQVLWVMMPEEMLPPSKRSTAEARLKSYKNRAYCLLDFEADVKAKDLDLSLSKPEELAEDERRKLDAQKRYKYFVDMAGLAWKEYLKWRHHEKWKGKYLKTSTRAVRRVGDELTVADGVIFPILSAISFFVVFNQKADAWVVKVPSIFSDDEMIDAARDHLSSYGGNPMLMGRSAPVYDQLKSLPKMVLRLSERMEATSVA